MKVAIFGGSFDPVHTQHVRLAQSAIESLQLDKLYVMPAKAPPHKPYKKMLADAHRIAMCKLAFSGVPEVEISDYELSRGGTSYTYLTCKHFKELYPNANLFWLVGTDMLRDFPTWKNTQDILSCATLAVCARAEAGEWLEREQQAFFNRFQTHFAVIEDNCNPVSSTQVRVLAAAGEDTASLVGEKVAAYIREHKLYEIAGASEALALLPEKRKAHVIRVAALAAARAGALKMDERQVLTAALMHDSAKYLSLESPLLSGFTLKSEWGEVPQAVLHQFTGAYLAQNRFGVTDEDVLSAVRFHTSGRENMSLLEKLIFLADMLEEGRKFEGVERLRKLFWKDSSSAENALDEAMQEALKCSVRFVESKGEGVYPLTLHALKYYQKQNQTIEKTEE